MARLILDFVVIHRSNYIGLILLSILINHQVFDSFNVLTYEKLFRIYYEILITLNLLILIFSLTFNF